jgi:hypothetical protein
MVITDSSSVNQVGYGLYWEPEYRRHNRDAITRITPQFVLVDGTTVDFVDDIVVRIKGEGVVVSYTDYSIWLESID